MSSSSISRSIFIYNGPGVDAGCAGATSDLFVDLFGKSSVFTHSNPDDFTSDQCLQKGNILVVPGGSTPTIEKSLVRDAKGLNTKCLGRIISSINDNTTSYVGICAGSYLMMKDLCYVREARSLPRIAQTGSSMFYTPEFEPSRSPKVVAVIDTVARNTMKMICWSGGAFFEDSLQPGEESVAVYGLDENQIAVLKPRRNVLLSNVHPEFSVRDSFPDLGLTQAEQSELLDSAPAVKKWFATQLNSLGVASALPEDDNEFTKVL